MGGVPRVQKMLKGHLPRVINLQMYLYAKKITGKFVSGLGTLKRGTAWQEKGAGSMPLSKTGTPMTKLNIPRYRGTSLIRTPPPPRTTIGP